MWPRSADCDAIVEEHGNKPMKHRAPDSHDIFHQIKYYAVEIAATIVFLAWLVRAVWHELVF
jgi:hypothetical protein